MPKINLVTPAGRLVSGSVTVALTKDDKGKLYDVPKYFFAIAVAKNHPQLPQLFQTLYNHACSEYSNVPDVLRRIALGLARNTGFSWKIDDGDLPSSKTGKMREGWAGCRVFKFTTQYVPQCVDVNNQFINGSIIERGMNIDVAFSAVRNPNTDHTAGLYMNPNFVRFLGDDGTRYSSGPTPDQAFGAAGQAVGSPTPLAPAGMTGGYGASAPQPQGMPGIGYGGGAMTQPAPMGNGYATPAAPGMPMGYGAPLPTLTPAPQSPSMYAAPAPAMLQQFPATPPVTGNGYKPHVSELLKESATAYFLEQTNDRVKGITDPLALPASVPDVQGGAISVPVQMPGMTPPVNDSATAFPTNSDAPAPTIPGFSSGAAQ